MLMVGCERGMVVVGAVRAAPRGFALVVTMLHDHCLLDSDLSRYRQRIGVPHPGQHKGHSQSDDHGR